LDLLERLVRPRRMPLPRTVLITGSASGIGRAVALEYARRGVSKLVLADRNEAALASVASDCRAASASAPASPSTGASGGAAAVPAFRGKHLRDHCVCRACVRPTCCGRLKHKTCLRRVTPTALAGLLTQSTAAASTHVACPSTRPQYDDWPQSLPAPLT
jgi:NAD(P)-dependent dehydrogenase (short-subunit alcohol dehydrogenase family)